MTPTTRKLDGQILQVSSLDKVYWSEPDITKGDMLDYYTAIAPTLLPYLKERPVTMRVYPEGINGFSYYRRDLPKNAPSWLRSVQYQPETTDQTIQLPLVDDTAGLVWLANQGSIEFHMWASHLPDLMEPDLVIFDLDPGDVASFSEVLMAASRLREYLERLNLRACAKTSGGQGLHVFLPLAPGYTFDAVREWVKSVAEQLAAVHPDLIAVAHGPTHIGHQVTVDYAQNSGGRNTAAPYTLRALPGAPVSTPLTWEEVESGQARPAQFTLRAIQERLERLGDPFAPVLQANQRLPSIAD